MERAYRDVPYHNAAHGACVTHGVHWLLSACPELQGVVGSPLEMFTVILAALAHDADHDGHNNHFHVATGSPLAVRYNDASVLENHHLATCFLTLTLTLTLTRCSRTITSPPASRCLPRPSVRCSPSWMPRRAGGCARR